MSNRLYGQKEADKALENSQHGSIVSLPGSKSFAETVIASRPSKKTVSAVPGAYEVKAAKLRPSLLPIEAVVEGIKAMEFGATKYGTHQWREVDLTEEDFLNALERHLIAYKQGEKNASDSGVSHLGHIIANCGILLSKFGSK